MTRETCSECKRPLPLPKGPTSPPTRKVAYYLPVDAAAAHQELLDGWAEWLGCKDKPFYQAKVIEFFGTFARQHEELKGMLA